MLWRPLRWTALKIMSVVSGKQKTGMRIVLFKLAWFILSALWWSCKCVGYKLANHNTYKTGKVEVAEVLTEWKVWGGIPVKKSMSFWWFHQLALPSLGYGINSLHSLQFRWMNIMQNILQVEEEFLNVFIVCLSSGSLIQDTLRSLVLGVPPSLLFLLLHLLLSLLYHHHQHHNNNPNINRHHSTTTNHVQQGESNYASRTGRREGSIC